jgi:predicted GIY-YIG superfamily endonuclease
MGQLLLIPDARPLEKRLGEKFFRQAPRRPGVYLMRDETGNVVYVGKAKDLRQRLNNYRVANPDRMPRRHLRMVREVKRIEFQFCPTESSALKHEAKLLRSLRPKFNRAGVWPGKARFIVWRLQDSRLEMTVVDTPEPGWQRFGPLGGNAMYLHRTLARMLWLACNPGCGLSELPAGWVHGRHMGQTLIDCGDAAGDAWRELETFFWGPAEQFLLWLGSKFTHRVLPFERALIDSEMEVLAEFGAKHRPNTDSASQLALL